AEKFVHNRRNVQLAEHNRCGHQQLPAWRPILTGCDALGLANKAGLVVTGFEKVSAKMEASEVIALLHGSDAAEDGAGKLDRKFAAIGKSARPGFDLDSVIVRELTIDEMSLAIGRPNVVHAGLRSGGATVRLLENAKRLRRFRAARA
ncbi:MAG: hypothetical protein K2Y05_11985, partial [Hyphomicrobiaceae bacterium]|nr:hypothetical protein [Hyphomicrobiaceae bacterium]